MCSLGTEQDQPSVSLRFTLHFPVWSSRNVINSVICPDIWLAIRICGYSWSPWKGEKLLFYFYSLNNNILGWVTSQMFYSHFPLEDWIIQTLNTLSLNSTGDIPGIPSNNTPTLVWARGGQGNLSQLLCPQTTSMNLLLPCSLQSHPTQISFMPFLFLYLHTQVHILPKLHKLTEATPPSSQPSHTPPPSTHKNQAQLPVISWSQLSTATSCFFFTAPTHVFRQTPKGASSPCHILSPALHKSGSHSTTQKFHCDTSCLQEIPNQGCQSTQFSICACGTTNTQQTSTRGKKRKTHLHLTLCENRYFKLLKL